MITRSIGSSQSSSRAGSRRSESASSTKIRMRPPLPASTSPLTSVACSRRAAHGARRRPDGSAETLDEIGGPAVVRSLGEQHAHLLPVRVEVIVGRQERVDQRDLVLGLEANDRNFLGPVFAWLPVRVR